MATFIEKNTKKIVEQKLDALFAKQQQLNNNAGATPKMPWGGDGPGDYYRNSMFNNKSYPFDLGAYGDASIYGGMTNNSTKPIGLPNVNVYGARPTYDPYNPLTNQNLMTSPPYGANPGYRQNAVTGMGYTNTNGVGAFKDPYQVKFNRPELSGNASWFQKPNATFPTPTGAKSVAASSNAATGPTMARTDNLSMPDFWGKDKGPNAFNNLKGDNYKLAPGPKKIEAKTTNWGKVGTFAAGAAPILYNMIKGMQRPEVTTPNYNPYEGDIRSAMRNRRFNIEPLLNSNLTAQAVSNRNIKSAANSRGELMSNLGAAQNYRMIGDASAWATKNNMDNQYLGEQAQMDYGLGQGRSQMDWMTQTANSQNKAVTNQFLGQGFQDLGEFGQTQQLMSNQRYRDAQLASLYPDMFSQIYKFQPFMQEIIGSARTAGGLG